ncbi:hypothetical protein [Sphingomonas profundi]|uniref:hypothetical protein n=1 Tax=Alterirhizorhabdus profundi TaxID=2681549 RepID=UPI0012E8DF79|nr:hypothetical protein [Sphingomonas profundi]
MREAAGPRRPTAAILAVPAVLALATAAGLALGLAGDGGAWDAAAAIGLGLSPVAILWALLRSRGA